MAENGVVVTTELAADNRFGFVNVPRGNPLLLRFRHNERDYYATLGRWFVLDGDRDDVVVDLRPRYLNTTGKHVNIKDAKIEVDYDLPLDEVFTIHARQRWTGTGGVQDYDNLTFSNNIGQLDRDRFDDNPDKCIRIAQIGSSHTVSLQVPIFEKTNIVIESELSVRLQHCVEVMSLGVNNGEIAANLPFLDAFVRKSNIHFVLFEHGSYVMNNFDPDLFRKGFGFDPAFRHIAYVAADQNQKLAPVRRSNEAALHSKPADLAPVVPGLPFWDTLRVPMPDLAPSAQNAYQHFSNVVDFVRRRFPGVTFVMFTGLDQAQCHRLCTRELRTEAGSLIPYGADVFVRTCGHSANPEARMRPSRGPARDESLVENLFALRLGRAFQHPRPSMAGQGADQRSRRDYHAPMTRLLISYGLPSRCIPAWPRHPRRSANCHTRSNT